MGMKKYDRRMVLPVATFRCWLVLDEAHTPAIEFRVIQLVNSTSHFTVRRKLHHSVGHKTHQQITGRHQPVSTLLVGCQEQHQACKNWPMRCWCGYLSGARCRLFAYGPADVTAIPQPNPSPRLNPDWFYLSGTGLPRLSWKRGR